LDIRTREWAKLSFKDPKKILTDLADIQCLANESELEGKVRNLRQNSQKPYREGWHAALFCYGMTCKLELPVYFSMYEDQDYDFIAMYYKDDLQHFVPVQLKEYVSSKLSSEQTLEKEIEKLAKYSDSKDLTAVIYVSKEESLDFKNIVIPKLDIAGLWIMGSMSVDQRRFFLAGDLLKSPTLEEFNHPVFGFDKVPN
jgi:hypothetical protein